MAEKYNLKNPAVKRILQEVKEMQSNPCDDFMSLPLEENIFEWQFAVRGPCETEFEGGIYHGRIQLPAEYPFKPPSFMLLTPNGRFETQTKICLSISNHHPEHWQPSWSVRTALVALIAFMPTNPNGALGSLDYKKEERRALAIKSREAPPRFGTPERQKLIDEDPEEQHPDNGEDETRVSSPNPKTPASEGPQGRTEVDRIVEEPANANPHPSGVEAPTEIPSSVSSNQLPEDSDERVLNPRPETRGQKPDDRLFTLAAIGLTIAIVVLLLKKFIKSVEHGAVFMGGS
ncbi:ubiquitin-conjugating enzyme E2 32-like isoform X2 [Prosopis cineraria]|uniref:ubiquitin-conjugating enzyme E2 32-like isoform X2 n=1 Tax=Prosopis cineraria TaxID=364024 RepID=UPI00240ED7C6|nr:ubiquitin-conjugating enzyme E2 32-like isoform X2 [Prosopis cineraria]XP_054804718.1 ubiquitin-conjugating enzyme E2 32-like isoform X2 [Prosopis cineraria]